jgi:copper(I)-binding protein
VIRPVRRRTAVLAVPPVLALALVGCGSVHEQTQQVYDPADGTSADAGDIAVRNVVVVASENGDEATVFASFANRGAEDRLVEVHVDESAATPPDGSLELPAGGYASLSPDSNRLDVDGGDIEPGQFVEIEFRFEQAPRATVEALVKPADGLYEDALISPRSTPSA